MQLWIKSEKKNVQGFSGIILDHDLYIALPTELSMKPHMTWEQVNIMNIRKKF